MRKLRYAKYSAVAIGSLVTAFSSQAFAQEADADEGEIIVTAQRRSESIQSVPIAIQAIGGDDLADRGVKTAQDLAQYTPNVTIMSPAGPGSQPNITIRGIGLNDFNTNNAGPNGVYVDEFYISAPTAQGNSIFDLDRVEVLKGPQGTLYGRNTSGGAINFITTKPSYDFSARLRTEYASYDTVNVEAAVGGGLSETVSARIAGVFNNSRGYLRNTFLNRWENGTNNFALRGQLQFEPTPDLTILLKAQYAYSKVRPTNYRLVGTLDAVNFDPVAVLLGTPIKCSVADTLGGNCVDLFATPTSADFYSGQYNRSQKGKTTDFQTTMRIDYALGSVDVTSISGYNRNKRFFPEDTDASPARILEIDYGTLSKEFTQELRASQAMDNYNWVAGVYYLNERLNQDQPLYVYQDIDLLFGAPGSGDGLAQIFATTNRQKTTSLAAFGQLEYEIAPDLRLVAGARYTQDKKTFDADSSFRFQQGGIDSYGAPVGISSISNRLKQAKFNWRLGANYKFTQDVMAYVNIATGYKSGGFNGGFIVADGPTREAALAPVKPETVMSYEVGLKSTFWDRRVTLNLAGFYNDYKNQQTLVQVNRDGVIVFTLDNAQKARTYGLDAELSVRPVEGLTLSGQLGLLNSKLTKFVASRDPAAPDYSGNDLTFAPRQTLALSADYERQLGRVLFKIRYDTNYRAKHFFDPSNTPYAMSPGYWLHNARVALGFGDGKFEVGAFARNFTKTKYVITGSDLTLTTGSIQQVYGQPRMLGVDFNVKY